MSGISHDWDAIDASSLLPLLGVRRMSRKYGFLLRHYWMPATELTFERTTVQNGQTVREKIVQQPGKCDADVCVWRETVSTMEGLPDELVRGVPTLMEEHFCIYNRSDQTFYTKAITAFEALPSNLGAARKQAFLRQPILIPLLPVPFGFQWHVPAEDGFMEFQIADAADVKGMPVVFVRRKGRFSMDKYFRFGEIRQERYFVEREGVTAFALDRSIILEDRTHDVIHELNIETWTTQKLIKSEMPDTV